MSDDLIRDQFEDAFNALYPITYKAAKAGEPKAHGDMSCAWWGWKASRDAVALKLGQLDQLLQAIPACAEHDPCVPFALQWIGDMKRQLAEIAETRDGLQIDIEGLRKDAERYRWFKSKFHDEGLVIAKCTEWSIASWSGDDPDGEIDKAMAKERGQ